MNTIRSIRRIRRMIIVGAVLGVMSALLVAPASAGIPLAFQMIVNGGFEAGTPIVPDLNPWTIKNKTGDKIVCLSKTPVGTTGDCSFQFKGSIGEAAKLMQKMNEAQLDGFDAQMLAGAQISFGYDYSSVYIASSLSAKVVVKYTAPGFILPQKVKLTDTSTGATSIPSLAVWVDEGPATTAAIPAGANLTKFKAAITNKSLSGKAFIDNVSVVLTPNS
ncbi:MAG: hypothetical protein IPM16_13965 [Chloroflexi bacterium]|nr:hypothetical protein [Chloroflexota bacterium]